MIRISGFVFFFCAPLVLLPTCTLALQQPGESSRRSFMVGAAGSVSSLWIGGRIEHVLADTYSPAGCGGILQPDVQKVNSRTSPTRLSTMLDTPRIAESTPSRHDPE
jgi:hypothetical protein